MQLELIKFPDGQYGIRRGLFAKQYYAFNSGLWCTRRDSGDVRPQCRADEATARKVYEALDINLELVVDTRAC